MSWLQIPSAISNALVSSFDAPRVRPRCAPAILVRFAPEAAANHPYLLRKQSALRNDGIHRPDCISQFQIQLHRSPQREFNLRNWERIFPIKGHRKFIRSQAREVNDSDIRTTSSGRRLLARSQKLIAISRHPSLQQRIDWPSNLPISKWRTR